MRARDDAVAAIRDLRVRVPYRTYEPANCTEPSPLIIYLHGSGETGDDLDRLEKAGLPRQLRDGLELPFVVVCPQCRETWDPEALEVLLDALIESGRFDPRRVYVCGVSLGALGTWAFANRVASRLAAIVPICGPAERIDVKRFRELPVRCVHGAMDSVVPIGESVKMVRALRNAGCNVTFDVYADVDHDVWNHCLVDELWQWLLSHVRSA